MKKQIGLRCLAALKSKSLSALEEMHKLPTRATASAKP